MILLINLECEGLNSSFMLVLSRVDPTHLHTITECSCVGPSVFHGVPMMAVWSPQEEAALSRMSMFVPKDAFNVYSKVPASAESAPAPVSVRSCSAPASARLTQVSVPALLSPVKDSVGSSPLISAATLFHPRPASSSLASAPVRVQHPGPFLQAGGLPGSEATCPWLWGWLHTCAKFWSCHTCTPQALCKLCHGWILHPIAVAQKVGKTQLFPLVTKLVSEIR